MENQKIIDEIESFCSEKYCGWVTGSSSYTFINQEIFFSKDRQKVAFIIKKTASNMIGGTVGGIYYPFVHKFYEIKYILCIRDLDTQNVFLEIELSSDPSGDLDIDKILHFSDTYDKFIILLKNGVLVGIIRTDKEISDRFPQILPDELREKYGEKNITLFVMILV